MVNSAYTRCANQDVCDSRNGVQAVEVSLTSLWHHVEWIEGGHPTRSYPQPHAFRAVGPAVWNSLPERSLATVCWARGRTTGEGIDYVSAVAEKEREHHHQ